MTIQDAFDIWLGDQYVKEDIFNTAKYNDNCNSALDDIDRYAQNIISNNKKTKDHSLEDSIRDYPDLLNEFKNLWTEVWGLE